jgi:metal-responsive CopG/Arc/MetJ family transcriptional regulator
MGQKQNNIPVSMDDAFLAEIDSVAETRKTSRSAVMRDALRAGLEIVKAGGAADVLTLDSELSQDIEAEAKRGNRTRNSVLLEAIRHGIKAVDTYQMIKEAKEKEGMDDAMAQAILAHWAFDLYPEKRAVRVAMAERAVYWQQVWDLVTHVPEARERKEAIEKLIKMRLTTKQWPKVWGCGLSTTEIKWQAAMLEKYGPDSSQWPKEEIEKRERERKAGTDKGKNPGDSPDVSAIPPALAKALNEPETRAKLIEEARRRVETNTISPAATSDVMPQSAAPSKPSKPAKKKPGK